MGDVTNPDHKPAEPPSWKEASRRRRTSSPWAASSASSSWTARRSSTCPSSSRFAGASTIRRRSVVAGARRTRAGAGAAHDGEGPEGEARRGEYLAEWRRRGWFPAYFRRDARLLRGVVVATPTASRRMSRRRFRGCWTRSCARSGRARRRSWRKKRVWRRRNRWTRSCARNSRDGDDERPEGGGSIEQTVGQTVRCRPLPSARLPRRRRRSGATRTRGWTRGWTGGGVRGRVWTNRRWTSWTGRRWNSRCFSPRPPTSSYVVTLITTLLARRIPAGTSGHPSPNPKPTTVAEVAWETWRENQLREHPGAPWRSASGHTGCRLWRRRDRRQDRLCRRAGGGGTATGRTADPAGRTSTRDGGSARRTRAMPRGGGGRGGDDASGSRSEPTICPTICPTTPRV